LEVKKHSDICVELEERLRAIITQASGSGVSEGDVNVIIAGGAVRVDIAIMVPRHGELAASAVCQKISNAVRHGDWTDYVAADVSGLPRIHTVVDGKMAGGGVTSPSIEHNGDYDYVCFCMTLLGLSTEINKRYHLKTALLKRLKEIVLGTLGSPSVELEDVDVQLQSGAVLLESTVSVPQFGKVTAQSVIETLQAAVYQQSWGEGVAMELWSIPDIGSVVDGRLELGAVTSPMLKRPCDSGRGNNKGELKMCYRLAEDFTSSLVRSAALMRCLGDDKDQGDWSI
jgi:hypothetical protein